jgi:hypothetical protein
MLKSIDVICTSSGCSGIIWYIYISVTLYYISIMLLVKAIMKAPAKAKVKATVKANFRATVKAIVNATVKA